MADDPYEGYGPCFCLGCIGHGRCEHDDADDDEEFFCGDPDCGCGDDSDGWGEPAGAWVVTETAFTDRGLL